MANVSGQSQIFSSTELRQGSLVNTIDRWIYVFMASWFLATVLIGFIPDSIAKVSAIQAGQQPPFPLVLHVHAVLMGAWILLLLVQSTLQAMGHRSLHKQLGMAAFGLAPLMVITGFFLVPAMFHLNWAQMQLAPPEALPEIEITKKFISSLVAAQIATGVMFSVIVTWALVVRKTDTGMHRRLMVLATALPLPAAIDRIQWLPTTYPDSFLSPALYTVLWIMPLLVWDLLRHKTLHRAYVVWFAVFVPVAILVCNLWWSPWWIDTAQRLMGVTL